MKSIWTPDILIAVFNFTPCVISPIHFLAYSHPVEELTSLLFQVFMLCLNSWMNVWSDYTQSRLNEYIFSRAILVNIWLAF